MTEGKDVASSWEWGRLLGKGSYGDVFLAWEAGKADAYAVKVVRLHRGMGLDKCSEFLKEVGIMRKMGQHDRIVNCVGSMFDERGMLCIVMEYMGGGPLGAHLRSSDALPNITAAKCMKQILEGLKHLHANSIYHRDLKGDNILIKHLYTCGTPVLKIADFGNSKVRETQVRDSVISSLNNTTHADTVAGTALWMAPEVIRAAKNADGYSAAKSDVWSLGIVHCEVLNQGKTPWPSYEHPVQALFDIAQFDGGEEGKGLPPKVPVNLEKQCADFMAHCLRVNTQHRPSAATLLQHPYLNKIDPRPVGTLDIKYDSSPPLKEHEKISDTSKLFPVETPMRLSILCKSAGVDLDAGVEKRELAEPDFIQTSTWTEISTGSVELTPPVSPSPSGALRVDEDACEDEADVECRTATSEGESFYVEDDKDDDLIDELAEEQEYLAELEEEERSRINNETAGLIEQLEDEEEAEEAFQQQLERDSDSDDGITMEELLHSHAGLVQRPDSLNETYDMTAEVASPATPIGSLGMMSGVPPPPVMKKNTVSVQDVCVSDLDFAIPHLGFGRRNQQQQQPGSPDSPNSSGYQLPAAPAMGGALSVAEDRRVPRPLMMMGGVMSNPSTTPTTPATARVMTPATPAMLEESVKRTPPNMGNAPRLGGSVSVRLAVSAFQKPSSPVMRRHSTGPGASFSPASSANGSPNSVFTPPGVDTGSSPPLTPQQSRDRRNSAPNTNFMPTFATHEARHIPHGLVRDTRRVFEPNSPLSSRQFNPALYSRV